MDRRLGNVYRVGIPPDLSLRGKEASVAGIAEEARPWRRAIAWLLLLGPFFFASYGFATWISSQRTDVGFIVFAWERHIPLLPWTIIPYWLIDRRGDGNFTQESMGSPDVSVPQWVIGTF